MMSTSVSLLLAHRPATTKWGHTDVAATVGTGLPATRFLVWVRMSAITY